MNQFNLHAAFLLLVAVCIGGWAFSQVVRPENVLDVILLLSMCK